MYFMVKGHTYLIEVTHHIKVKGHTYLVEVSFHPLYFSEEIFLSLRRQHVLPFLLLLPFWGSPGSPHYRMFGGSPDSELGKVMRL